MIYLLEDDDGIRELVLYALEKTGYTALGFSHPNGFYDALKNELPELVLLDIMLPEEDGISILKRLKTESFGADIPIIMLTAKSSEVDKVKALDLGADDYITKPFGVLELLARVKAVLRRIEKRGSQGESKHPSDGGLVILEESHEVFVDTEPVMLTLKEFELLNLLFKNRGCVVKRKHIFKEVWGFDTDEDSRTIDVHIRTLRRKIGKYGELIETVRGVGYKMAGSKV